MTILERGDRVDLGAQGWGTVVGPFVGSRVTEPTPPQLWYVIELDDGFWSEDRESFVTLLIVHGDSGPIQAAEADETYAPAEH